MRRPPSASHSATPGLSLRQQSDCLFEHLIPDLLSLTVKVRRPPSPSHSATPGLSLRQAIHAHSKTCVLPFPHPQPAFLSCRNIGTEDMAGTAQAEGNSARELAS